MLSFSPTRSGFLWRRLGVVTPWLALVTLASSAWAQSAATTPMRGEQRVADARARDARGVVDARGWLQRINQASTQTSYSGTMVHSADGRMSSTKITRYGLGANTYEVDEMLDGPPRLVYKHNQLIHTLWPAKKVAVIEQREPQAAVAAPQGGTGAEALSSYDVRLEAIDRVAARPAQVLLLAPKDQARYPQRLWADVETGLMLRADVLDHEGRVLESSAFTDLRTGIRPQPEAILSAMHRIEGYRVVRAVITRTKLEQEGWRLAVPVSGFQQISCVSRPRDGGEPGPGSSTIVQSIYSDGMVHISVFIEPYQSERHQPFVSSRGATSTLGQRRDDRWITVVGDVPAATIQLFANALQPLR